MFLLARQVDPTPNTFRQAGQTRLDGGITLPHFPTYKREEQKISAPSFEIRLLPLFCILGSVEMCCAEDVAKVAVRMC